MTVYAPEFSPGGILPTWSTACPDWRERIIAQPQRSLIPFPPLFPAEAAAALAVFKSLRLARLHGSPTLGEVCRPWVFDLVAAIFGAYGVEFGRRFIRYFMLLVAKKNSKSTIAAAIMLTALIRNGRQGGEFYVLAPTKEIADNAYLPALAMVGANPALKGILHTQVNHRTLTHRTTGAFLKVLAADNETVSGKNAIGIFVDELWLFGKRANAGAMLQEAMGGMATNPEGFVIYATTQSDAPPAGVFAQTLDLFRDVRDGKIDDPERLGILYEYPEELIKREAYGDPATWYVSNPNLGASVDMAYLRSQSTTTRREGRASYAQFLAKHLNVQIGMSLRADGWAGAQVWELGADPALTLGALLDRSEVVTIGIDGGGLDDLLGIAVIGRERTTKRWLVWGHAMISDIGAERRKANGDFYADFETDGDLTRFVYAEPTEGGVWIPTPVAFVVDLVRRVQERGLLACVGVDRHGIGAIVDGLATIGVTQDEGTLDAIPQGTALMGAIKTVEVKLADRTLQHGGQRMMAWCAGNAIVKPTATAMMIARDEAGFGKVDPLMAVFDAAYLMSLNPEPAFDTLPADYEMPVWA